VAHRFAARPVEYFSGSVSVIAVSLLVLDYILVSPNFYGTFFFGKTTIIIYWILQMFFLGGPRIAYRYFRYSRTRQHARTARIRADPHSRPRSGCGSAPARNRKWRGQENLAGRYPVAVCLGSSQSIRGIPVRGSFDDLVRVVNDLGNAGRRVTRVVLTPSAFETEAKPETLLMQARRLGLTTSRLALRSTKRRGLASCAGQCRRPSAASDG
jgi:O-antigen biosynthesis protein WbqV